jgi:ABC-type transporter Mla subunit MlaD
VTDIRPPKILRDMKTNQFYYQSIVVLSIDKKYNNIPADVDIKLMTRGLGSSYIEILAKPETFDPNRPDAKFLVDEIMIQGSTGVASEFFPPESQKKLELLVEDLSVLIRSANDILGDKQNQENVKMALGNLSKASNQAAGAVEEFKKFFAEATYTSEELSKTVSQLRIILEKINSGEGTAGMLVNDGRLYENLLENTEQLKMLLEDLKAFVKESSDKGVPIKLK